ncbi:MAG: hypothetical protein EHM78_16600 [Myxococcaceae bacterium]|nr:MAG: hypothetical protein EHM78_16600 [Myxococcaceae bacterium]
MGGGGHGRAVAGRRGAGGARGRRAAAGQDLQGGRAAVPGSAGLGKHAEVLQDGLLDGDVSPPIDRQPAGREGDSHRQPGW